MCPTRSPQLLRSAGLRRHTEGVNGDNKASLFVKQLNVEWTQDWGRLKVGRMEFADGVRCR